MSFKIEENQEDKWTFPAVRGFIKPLPDSIVQEMANLSISDKVATNLKQVGTFRATPLSTLKNELSFPQVVETVDCRARYFHATKIEGLQGILQSQAIFVTHEGGYKGAFVSTKPETPTYGRYVIGLNTEVENAIVIERASCVTSGKKPHCWAGSSKPIPVNEETLEWIGVDHGTSEEIQKLQEEVSIWAERKVKVIPLDSIDECVVRNNKRIFIPEEWVEKGWRTDDY